MSIETSTASTSAHPQCAPGSQEQHFTSMLTSLERLASNQIDAQRLDNELHALLMEQASAATAYAPELLGGCLAASSTTPGAAMMNLRFRNERAACNGGRTGVEGPGASPLQRLALVLGWVVLPYAWQRGVGAVAAQGWHHLDPASLRGRIAALLPRLEGAARAAALVNTLAFLRWGRYRSLLERVVAAQLVYDRPVMARVVSFDYLNRQLVWSEVSELFLFLLPLLDTRRSGGLLQQWTRRLLAPLRGALRSGDGVRRDACQCQVCASQPANTPYAAVDCGHVFCYYCLRARTEADAGYCCPTCERPVRGMAPAAALHAAAATS